MLLPHNKNFLTLSEAKSLFDGEECQIENGKEWTAVRQRKSDTTTLVQETDFLTVKDVLEAFVRGEAEGDEYIVAHKMWLLKISMFLVGTPE